MYWKVDSIDSVVSPFCLVYIGGDTFYPCNLYMPHIPMHILLHIPRFRAGKKHRRHSHIRLVLREIDFPTKLLEAKSINQKRKWLEYLRIARKDYERAKVDRAELAELEAMAAQLEEEARKKKEEEASK